MTLQTHQAKIQVCGKESNDGKDGKKEKKEKKKKTTINMDRLNYSVMSTLLGKLERIG